MEKRWIITALILVITGISLGAFGAHGLRSVTSDPKILNAFDTAVDYQLLHGVGFLLVPFLFQYFSVSSKLVKRFLLVGILLFSGSIYGLTLVKLLNLEQFKVVFGPLTPIGGLALIIGWLSLLVLIVNSNKPLQK